MSVDEYKIESLTTIEDKEPNGVIDTSFVQGYTGDCWFLSALQSMCSDKYVLNKINNMITINKENNIITSVTVNIQGKDYTIDYDNLKGAKEYATGDLDARALEMAMNLYMHENNLGEGDISLGWDEDDAYRFLFGNDNVEICKYENEKEDFDNDKYLNKIKEKSNNKIISNVYINAYNSYFEEQEKYYAEDENGKQIELLFSHSYVYKRIDDKYYYFNDPQAPERELHISVEDFAKTFDGAITVKFKNNEEQASLSY